MHISYLAPIGMARQFEQQSDAARRILYVQGGWLCNLLFEITPPLGNTTLSTLFSELKPRIYSATFLQESQRAPLTKIFEEATTGIASQPRCGRRQLLRPR